MFYAINIELDRNFQFNHTLYKTVVLTRDSRPADMETGRVQYQVR